MQRWEQMCTKRAGPHGQPVKCQMEERERKNKVSSTPSFRENVGELVDMFKKTEAQTVMQHKNIFQIEPSSNV